MLYKFPLTSGNVTRFFVVFNLVLLLALGFMVHNSVNAWLTGKRYAMDDLARDVQKRIDAYRFATWQIYETSLPVRQVQHPAVTCRRRDCVLTSTTWKKPGVKRKR